MCFIDCINVTEQDETSAKSELAECEFLSAVMPLPNENVNATVAIPTNDNGNDTDEKQEWLRCLIGETFQEVDGGAALTESGHMARYCFRALAKYPIIYGCKRYMFGTHRVRFQIEKHGDLRCFFGVMTSLESVCRVISIETDNRSLYGWWDLNINVRNGRVERNQKKNELKTNDQLTLTLKCDHQEIELEHHRTNRILKTTIDILACPLPWKIVVELTSYGDCVRILP
jgi:hypothetical protein